MTELVDPTLFADEDASALAGSRCRSCATVAFPAQRSCPRCTGVDVEDHRLATNGTLWAFTEQLFPPKTPYAVQGAGFRPFVVGYVDLAGEVIVESRIIAPFDSLRIGQPMRLVADHFTPRRRSGARSPSRPPRSCPMADDEVAIVGIGIHPFGRTEGVSGRQQGAVRCARGPAPTPGSGGTTSSSPSAAATQQATPTPSSPTSA